MPKEKFKDLNSLLKAAESIQTKMLNLQDDLSIDIYKKVLEHYSKISTEKHCITKLHDLITKATVQLTHEVEELYDTIHKDSYFSRQ